MLVRLLLSAWLCVMAAGLGESECPLEVTFVVDPDSAGREFSALSSSFDFESSYSLANSTYFRVVAGAFATARAYRFKTKEECTELIETVRANYEGGTGQLNLALETTYQLLSNESTGSIPSQRKLKFVFIVTEGVTDSIQFWRVVRISNLPDVYVFVISNSLDRSLALQLSSGNYDRILLDFGWRSQMKIAKQRWLLCPSPADADFARRLPSLKLSDPGASCRHESHQPQCVGPKRRGLPCACAPGIKWHYNKEKQECVAFSFLGCGGGGNRWDNREDCMSVCAPRRTCWESPELRARLGTGASVCFRPSRFPGAETFEPYCCDRNITNWYNDAYRNHCPNHAIAYKTIPRNRDGMFRGSFVAAPFIGDTCDDLPCPPGFRCTQINPIFAKCCQTSFEETPPRRAAVIAPQQEEQTSEIKIQSTCPTPKPLPLAVQLGDSNCWREWSDCEGCLRQADACPPTDGCVVDVVVAVDSQDVQTLRLMKRTLGLLLEKLRVSPFDARFALFDYGHRDRLERIVSLEEHDSNKAAILAKINGLKKPAIQAACNTLSSFNTSVAAELSSLRAGASKVFLFFPSQCYHLNQARFKSVLASLSGWETRVVYAEEETGLRFRRPWASGLGVSSFSHRGCEVGGLVSLLAHAHCPPRLASP